MQLLEIRTRLYLYIKEKLRSNSVKGEKRNCLYICFLNIFLFSEVRRFIWKTEFFNIIKCIYCVPPPISLTLVILIYRIITLVILNIVIYTGNYLSYLGYYLLHLLNMFFLINWCCSTTKSWNFWLYLI